MRRSPRTHEEWQNTTTFRESIRTIMFLTGKKKGEIATDLQISAPSLSDYESGRALVPRPVLERTKELRDKVRRESKGISNAIDMERYIAESVPKEQYDDLVEKYRILMQEYLKVVDRLIKRDSQ